MTEQKFKLKSDKYRKARGGYARFLNIFCSACGNHILLYQKDGSGPLKRIYFDRIFAPSKLSELQNQKDIKAIHNIVCSNCGLLVAIPYIYEKEQRPAAIMQRGSFVKKISKGVYPCLRN